MAQFGLLLLLSALVVFPTVGGRSQSQDFSRADTGDATQPPLLLTAHGTFMGLWNVSSKDLERVTISYCSPANVTSVAFDPVEYRVYCLAYDSGYRPYGGSGVPTQIVQVKDLLKHANRHNQMNLAGNLYLPSHLWLSQERIFDMELNHVSKDLFLMAEKKIMKCTVFKFDVKMYNSTCDDIFTLDDLPRSANVNELQDIEIDGHNELMFSVSKREYWAAENKTDGKLSKKAHQLVLMHDLSGKMLMGKKTEYFDADAAKADSPVGISVNPVLKKLYFAKRRTQPHYAVVIYEFPYDPINRTLGHSMFVGRVKPTHLTYPHKIAVDPTTGLLYWPTATLPRDWSESDSGLRYGKDFIVRNPTKMIRRKPAVYRPYNLSKESINKVVKLTTDFPHVSVLPVWNATILGQNDNQTRSIFDAEENAPLPPIDIDGPIILDW